MFRQFAPLLFVVIGFCVQAQPTYMEIFRATGTAKGDLNEMSSGNLRVGLARQSGSSLVSAGGAILQSHNYKVDSFLVLQTIKRYTDNEFYFGGGYRKDVCDSTGMAKLYPLVGKMDSLGNITSAWHYAMSSSTCANMTGDLEILSDGIAAWGIAPSNLFLLRTDLSGQPFWARRFGQNGSFQFVKELPGGFLAGINMDTAGAVVARLDADGNFLWCKSYMRPLGRVHDAIVEPDGSFIITGFTELATTDIFTPYPPDFHPKLFMMKLNGDGEVQWCRGHSTAPFHWYTHNASRIVRAQDGNYVVLANIGVPTQSFWYRPFLMKTDQNGDTLWTRSSGHVAYPYETTDLLAYSDGSFIFNGRIWGEMPDGSNNNWAYLYKTDSLGHLPCFEQYFPLVVSDLFPVDSSFTLTSVDGAERRPAFVNDTIYEPIVVYDGCTFATSIPSIVSRPNGKPRVYPNPNTGRFTVEFADPLMAESYYSVYDALGKLLYQRALPTGATIQEVDLSRYGRGTYAIKFTSPDGVCYERVVLE